MATLRRCQVGTASFQVAVAAAYSTITVSAPRNLPGEGGDVVGVDPRHPETYPDLLGAQLGGQHRSEGDDVRSEAGVDRGGRLGGGQLARTSPDR